MVWWMYLLGGILIFVFFKKGVLEKIEELKKWWKLNKDKLTEWQENQEIMTAFNALKRAIEQAQLDRKWDLGEILLVLGLAGQLINLIKKYEEEK